MNKVASYKKVTDSLVISAADISTINSIINKFDPQEFHQKACVEISSLIIFMAGINHNYAQQHKVEKFGL